MLKDSKDKGARCVCRHLIQRTKRRPGGGCLIVMPRRFAVRARRGLIRLTPGRTVVGVSILDFGHLTCHIFSSVKVRSVRILRRAKGGLILHELTRRRRRALAILQTGVGQVKCVKRMGSVVSRLIRCQVSPRRLISLARSGAVSPMLSTGLHSITAVCHTFYSFVGSDFIATRRVLGILGGLIPRSRALQSTILMFSRFANFAPVRGSLVQRLLRIARRVCVALAVSTTRSFCRYDKGRRLFTLSGGAVLSLVGVTRRLRIRIVRPIMVASDTRGHFGLTPTLTFVRRGLFHPHPTGCAGPMRRVRLTTMGGPRRRLVLITERVGTLVERKCHCQRVTIIANTIRTCRDCVSPIFAGCRVPCFVSAAGRILFRPFVRYVHTTLRVISAGFDCRTIVHFLQYKFYSVTRSSLSQLSDCLITANVHNGTT